MNWIDYKKLLDEEFKTAVELDDYRDKKMRGCDDKKMRDYNDKWMRDYRDKRMRDYDDNGCMIIRITGWRVNSGVPNSWSIVGVSQQPLNALAQLYSILSRDIHLVRKRFLIMKRNASLKEKS